MTASELVAQLKRTAVEERHGRRPFVDEREPRERLASETDRILERRLDRGRGREIGR